LLTGQVATRGAVLARNSAVIGPHFLLVGVRFGLVLSCELRFIVWAYTAVWVRVLRLIKFTFFFLRFLGECVILDANFFFWTFWLLLRWVYYLCLFYYFRLNSYVSLLIIERFVVPSLKRITSNSLSLLEITRFL
jgi:hypothetical protein